MQKLDFITNLSVISKELRSQEIVNIFNTGFNMPKNSYNYDLINPILFATKGNYDLLMKNESYKEILNPLLASTVYDEKKLADMVRRLVMTSANHIVVEADLINFFNFHNSILTTLKLCSKVLMTSSVSYNYHESINDGILVFQIVIDEEGLETGKYIKIFTALQELIETIAKVLGDSDPTQEIILLDSGSDTNVGIKSQVETANAIFLIFKEVWDFITNRKSYKQEKNNKALLDSLSIRGAVKNQVDAGVLTEEEGKQYVHLIKTRTDDLIGMKVLPKQIVMDSRIVENKKILSEYEGLRLLKNDE